jgi:hypothetical protein
MIKILVQHAPQRERHAKTLWTIRVWDTGSKRRRSVFSVEALDHTNKLKYEYTFEYWTNLAQTLYFPYEIFRKLLLEITNKKEKQYAKPERSFDVSGNKDPED